MGTINPDEKQEFERLCNQLGYDYIWRGEDKVSMWEVGGKTDNDTWRALEMPFFIALNSARSMADPANYPQEIRTHGPVE